MERRPGQVRTARGEKSELVRQAIRRKTQPFRIADLQADCPGVSTDMIRHVLKALECRGAWPEYPGQPIISVHLPW